MTKTKSTKRALLTSALALLMCVSMLIGSTFAWFTDSVTSAGNKIQAGTLKIDLLVKDDNGEYKSVKDSQDPIFNYDRWEPGYTEAVNVKVANMGTLALQYSLQVVTEGLVQELLDQDVMLSDAIDVYYADEDVVLADRDAFDAAVADGSLKLTGTLTDVIFGGAMVSDYLLPGFDAAGNAINPDESTDYATIVLKMRETAGNEYQGLSVGTKFDLKLFATQYTYENDSFDSKYDDIELPAATLMVAEDEVLNQYGLDAGAVFMTTEDTWSADTKYAYYFADFVVSVANTEDEMTLWGMYGTYGQQEFAVTDFEGGKEYRIMELADAALSYDMGNISYRQLIEQVGTFACGVKGLEVGNTVNVTLRLYETSLTKENANGSFSFEETGVYYDIAEYSYTKAADMSGANGVETGSVTNASMTIYDLSNNNSTSTEVLSMDTYKFDANKYIETYPVETYGDWICDYYVSTDKAINEGLILAGNYGDYDWIGFKVPASDEPYEDIGIVSLLDSNLTYTEVVENVGTFTCGLTDDGSNAGATVTVTLRMTNKTSNQVIDVASVTVVL